MTHRLSATLATLCLATFAACGSSAPTPPVPGTGGTTPTGGSGGETTPPASGGSGGTVGGGTGGSGTGGSVPVTPDAAVTADAGPPASASDGAAPGDGAVATTDGASTTPPVTGDMLGWFECEADGNMFTAPARVTECSAGPCAAGAVIKEGIECCSGGKKVSNVERGNGKLLMNNITAPADGDYDVAWWYHCGKNDNFGDPGCGGDPTKTASGCRPHVIEVNTVKLPKVYEFHCFPGSWGELHVSTVPMTLKAGTNSIRIYATGGRDAADLDAIALYPAGKGPMPTAFGH